MCFNDNLRMDSIYFALHERNNYYILVFQKTVCQLCLLKRWKERGVSGVPLSLTGNRRGLKKERGFVWQLEPRYGFGTRQRKTKTKRILFFFLCQNRCLGKRCCFNSNTNAQNETNAERSQRAVEKKAYKNIIRPKTMSFSVYVHFLGYLF